MIRSHDNRRGNINLIQQINNSFFLLFRITKLVNSKYDLETSE